MTELMTPEREALVRVLQDAVWPFLAHDPANPDLFWGQMARKVEEHYAAEVDRLRAQVAAVEALADWLDAYTDQYYAANKIRAALASGDDS